MLYSISVSLEPAAAFQHKEWPLRIRTVRSSLCTRPLLSAPGFHACDEVENHPWGLCVCKAHGEHVDCGAGTVLRGTVSTELPASLWFMEIE